MKDAIDTDGHFIQVTNREQYATCGECGKKVHAVNPSRPSHRSEWPAKPHWAHSPNQGEQARKCKQAWGNGGKSSEHQKLQDSLVPRERQEIVGRDEAGGRAIRIDSLTEPGRVAVEHQVSRMNPEQGAEYVARRRAAGFPHVVWDEVPRKPATLVDYAVIGGTRYGNLIYGLFTGVRRYIVTADVPAVVWGRREGGVDDDQWLFLPGYLLDDEEENGNRGLGVLIAADSTTRRRFKQFVGEGDSRDAWFDDPRKGLGARFDEAWARIVVGDWWPDVAEVRERMRRGLEPTQAAGVREWIIARRRRSHSSGASKAPAPPRTRSAVTSPAGLSEYLVLPTPVPSRYGYPTTPNHRRTA